MEAAKQKRTVQARKVTRKANEIYNAVKGEVHTSEIKEKIGTLKYCLQELSDVQDEYVNHFEAEQKDAVDAEERWFINYDNSVNAAIKAGRDYVLSKKDAQENQNQMSHIKLKKLEIPKFNSDPKSYYRWKSIYERYTKGYEEERKYDYLLEATTGEARRYVENKTTYGEAIARLDEKYGNVHIILGLLLNEIRSLQLIRRGDFIAFERLSLKVSDFQERLKLMGKENDVENSYILKEIEGKLNYEDVQKWLESMGDNVDIRTVDELSKWLEHQTHLRRITFNNHNASRNYTNLSEVRSNRRSPIASASTIVGSCPNCPLNHTLNQCPEFLALSHDERWEKVKYFRFCFLCLKPGHMRPDCNEAMCNVCQRPHHSTLHKPNNSTSETVNLAATSTTLNENRKNENRQIRRSFLPVVKIDVKSQTRKRKYTAVLDSCSEINVISSRCAHQLGLVGYPVNLKITGAGGCVKYMKGRMVEIVILTQVGKENKIECIVLSKACGKALELDKAVLESCGLSKLKEKRIYTKGGEIDLLIGMSNPALHRQFSMEELSNGMAIIETCFGHCLVGSNPMKGSNYEPGEYRSNFVSLEDDDNDEKKWRKHLEAETAGILPIEKEKSEEELLFEKRVRIYQNEEDGRFEVELPWKYDPKTLLNNRNQAIQSDLKLMNKLKENKAQEVIRKQIQEMVEMNVLKKVDHDFPRRYLSLLAVVNLDRETTQVRICVDSKRKYKGVSFNDYLLNGKFMLGDIFEMLTKFRCGDYAIQGDIKKMFWQLLLSSLDQQYHGVIYDGETYVFTRLCFGDKPSPVIADMCMKEIADLNKDKLPLGSDLLKKKRFVDDLLDAGNCLELMKQKRNETTTILGNFGFEIKEWLSNNPNLGTVKEENKVLGVLWDGKKDTFHLKGKNTDKVYPFTKRNILREIAEIWDPLGIVTAAMITGKLVFQAVVRMKLDWDQKVDDEELFKKWRSWLGDMEQIEDVVLSRSIFPSKGKMNEMNCELIGCCDGSAVACGCVMYIRWFDDKEENIEVKFVGAKAKLNSIGGTTTPRAELRGAFLLSRLAYSTEQALQDTELRGKIREKILFTDSTTVLSWVTTAAIKYKPFVKNKVIEMQELHNVNVWRYIPTSENVAADLLSKGCKTKELKKIVRGPEMLYTPKEKWKDKPGKIDKNEIDSEKCSSVCLNSVSLDGDDDILDVNRFQSWKKLIRVTSYVFRFISKKSEDTTNVLPNVTSEEFKQAETFWIKKIQKGMDVQAKHIIGLCPFTDEYEIIRVYGRIQEMPTFSKERKHPILIPKRHWANKLIVNDAHMASIHTGHSKVMAEVRKKFWIVGLKCLTKSVEKKCITCRRWRNMAMEQRMANLPLFRLCPSYPFENSAVDYFGPFKMKYGHRSFTKAFGAVFTCLVTRSVHVELATDVSTDTFLLALRRFISLYGTPKYLRSDNGTNFVGAAKLIKDMIQSWKEEGNERSKIVNFCNSRLVKWTFSTPTASHHNGAVESMIKSIKSSMNKIVNGQVFKEEEYRTLFSEITAIVNSRPLWPASDGDLSQPAITCNDLLRPSGLPKDPKELNVEINPRKRYEYIQKVTNDWWKIWLNNLPQSLQFRGKWYKERRNLEVGDITLIIDASTPRSKWVMAIIEAVYPGTDGLIRSARVRTKDGSYDRPITKLVLLVSKQELEQSNE